MNKEGLVRETQKLAKEAGLSISRDNTAIIVQSMLDAMVEGYREDKEVVLTNYLTIQEKEFAEKRVPVTVGSKEKKVKPAHKAVKVKPGKKFKDVTEEA